MKAENGSRAQLENLEYEIAINAPKQKVWNVLWEEESYNAWTSVFSEGSCAVSDWQEGSPIHFLDGKGSGMYSVIEKKIPNEFMSFKHIGEIKNGKEQPLDEKSKAWSGGLENYTLQEKDGKTYLRVTHEAPKEFLEFLNETFPKALQKIKDLAESKSKITIETNVKAPVEMVWEYWNKPEHITQWCAASDDWHTTRSENDVRISGKFIARMEAKDGSMGFDMEGVYTDIKTNELIKYTMSDGRKVKIIFTTVGNTTRVTETFEAEDENPIELQRSGWQAILDNFKKYVEKKMEALS